MMHVVTTAGHIDHGKSTLLRALTGHEPDRLIEEHRRGISIELGYVWTQLPGIGEVAFVDVPGHQRFVTTAFAGLGPVPVVLFVVAADDPWMAQAAEHLAALDALGVQHGLLAVTRVDLADPAPALARARVELARTTLADIPDVVVSGRTGAGMDRLRQLLTDVLTTVPHPDPGASIRLWVDRRFHIKGVGTVVTGTLQTGTIQAGDGLETEVDGERIQVRVRAVQSLGVRRQTISGVARVALDLGGRAPHSLSRGHVLVTPEAFAYTASVDVRLTGQQLERQPPEQPMLHAGSFSQQVRTRRLDDRHLRIQLQTPLPLRIGDRAILRDPGSRTLWGIRVLDPSPPALTRRGAAAQRATALAALDGSLDADLAIRGAARLDDYRRWGIAVENPPPGTATAGDWLVSAPRASEFRAALLAHVDAAPEPPTLAELARVLDLPDESLVAALAPAPLRVERGRLVDDRTTARLSAADRAALTRLRGLLAESPFAAPDAPTLTAIGIDDATAVRLHRAHHLLRLAPSIVLLPGADDEALVRLASLEQPFTTSAARHVLGTSRRAALALLAHLDRRQWTIRLADDTRQLMPQPRRR